MGNVADNVGVFLIDTLFDLYIVIVILRVLLALTRADFYNPLSQFIVKATNPPLTALRRVVPSIGKLDTAAIVLLVALKVVQLWLITMIANQNVGLAVLAIVAVKQLLELLIYVYIFAIIIQVVLSWVAPGVHNPVTSLSRSLTEPLMRPVRRLMPDTGMIDLSPLVVILGLNIVLIVLRSI